MTDATPSEDSLTPGLYIVATPIGNLGDITLRAVDVLRRCDGIACEDTRVTGKLLKHLGISKPMWRYDDHSEHRDRTRLVDSMRDRAVALVSDAGTPMVSDPGYRLVNDCRAEGIPVTALPGACAAVTGLALSGLPNDRFLFAGFLPSKDKARRETLAELAGVDSTLIFYETAPRLAKSLAASPIQPSAAAQAEAVGASARSPPPVQRPAAAAAASADLRRKRQVPAGARHPSARRPVLVAGVVGLIVNVLFDWLLMFGVGPFPRLGAEGCGWATALASLAMLLVMAWQHWRLPSLRAAQPWRRWIGGEPQLVPELLKLGVPIGLIWLAEVALFAGAGLLMALFGDGPVAAHQVAINIAAVANNTFSLFVLPLLLPRGRDPRKAARQT